MVQRFCDRCKTPLTLGLNYRDDYLWIDHTRCDLCLNCNDKYNILIRNFIKDTK